MIIQIVGKFMIPSLWRNYIIVDWHTCKEKDLDFIIMKVFLMKYNRIYGSEMSKKHVDIL